MPADAVPSASVPWWTRSTVYQIYPRSFADSNGDGIGDLQGIIARLDYLQRLGVDVLWLSPIYASPDHDNGYDISDYQAIDPRYGTFADFDELLSEAHRRDIKIVMDLVVNHTSSEHAWFRESRASRDDPRRNWYWWRPARPGTTPGAPGAEPTNWGSFFSGPTWTFDEQTGEYYLHLFASGQPDLNWENPEVRQAVYSMMRWWLDRGIDGFRMDVINVISKNVALPDGIIAPGHRYGDGSPHYICGPRVHEFIAEMHREVFAGRDRPLLTVGETPAVSIDHARQFTDPANAEVDMVFQFDHVGGDSAGSKWQPVPTTFDTVRDTLHRWQAGLADIGWNSLYLCNHDQPRSVSRFGDDGEHRVVSAKTLATVLHLQRGTPYVYQGEELGMTNIAFTSIDDYRDIETLRYYAEAMIAGNEPEALMAAIRPRSRDNARTPMHWDAGTNAGFTTGTPWIAVNPNHVTINAAAAIADDASVFHHYRRLIGLRRSSAVIATGVYELLFGDVSGAYVFRRFLAAAGDTDTAADDAGSGEILVIANCSGSPLTLDLPEAWLDATVLLWSHGIDATTLRATLAGDPSRGPATTLRPWESFVVSPTDPPV